MRNSNLTDPGPTSLTQDSGNAQVYREALTRTILSENPKPTVLIHAPAGHGKSTLLSQLAVKMGQLNERVVFFKVRQEYNDISRFFHDFQVALEKGIGGNPEASQKAVSLRNKGVSFTDYLLYQLTSGSQNVSVIFDDFHLLSNRAILAIMSDLLDRHLPKVRFIISSREIPGISIERLFINDKALLLGADDLRFSRSEIEHFVGHWGDQSFEQEDIDFFVQWTHGWPAGLQLLKLMLKDKVSLSALKAKKSIELPLLTSYLADNVMAVLPHETQDFLLKTSVLRSMSAPLCEAVTGCQDCQAILESIEQSGVFVSAIDDSYQWFAYHSIFASFLKSQLQTQLPDTKNMVHRKALQWFCEQNIYEESIYHAEALQAFDTMADILDVWSSELIIKAHLDTVEYWYDRLPESVLVSRPSLVVKVSWALIFLRRFNKLEALLIILDQQNKKGMIPDNTSVDIIRAVAALMNDDLRHCEKIIEGIDVEEASVDDFRAFELSAVANMQALFCLYKSDFEDARELLSISHAYSTNVSAVFSDSYSCGVNGFRLLSEGNANQAFSELEEEASSKELYMAGAFAASAVISCHAWVLYERNQLKSAREELESSLEAIIDSCLLDWMVMAFVALSRIYFVSAEYQRQTALLKRAETVGYARGWKRLIRVIQSERIRSGLLLGDISLAKSLSSRMARNNAERWPSNYIGFYGDTENDHIRAARIALYEGDMAGYDLIVEEISGARRLGRRRRLLTLLILKALFEKARGEVEKAFDDLEEAIAFAASEGYVRCFLDEGQALGSLLIELYSYASEQRSRYKNLDLVFVEKIISDFDMSNELIQVQKQKNAIFNESMTNRELQILELLEIGASNKDIAKTVFLSENTVKFHLKNIFLKLGVNNRTLAITVARENGLIN